MDFSIPNDVIELGKKAREFGQTELSNDIAIRDRNGATNPEDWRELWKKCAEYGLLGLAIPKEYGGSGLDIQTSVHILRELGYGCADGGLTLGLAAQIWSMQMPILEFGSETQKATYLPGLVSGDILCAHAVTEEQSGSDAMSLQTSATKVEGGYILKGTKTFIGMAPECDLAFVFATVNPEHGIWGISAFLVDSDFDGFIRRDQLHKLGTRTLPFGTLEFTDCFVPDRCLLGPQGSGNAIFNRSLEWERRFIFAPQVGAMERQLDECVDYAKSRTVFGDAIHTNQSVSNRLADMKLRLETAQLMLWRAAWEADNNISNFSRAAATKLHLSEAYLASSTDAMRTFGARGYLEDAITARAVRDALGGISYGGTSDIQRMIISSALIRK